MDEFNHFETLSFDCYGTLIDWETGIRNALEPWIARHSLDPDDIIAQFGQVETVVQTERPGLSYPEVLADVLRRIGEASGVATTEEEAAAFGASIGNWPPFPDSSEALNRLKKRFTLAILSNVDRASFAESNRLLDVEFDLIVTAEEVGSYKPNQQNFLALFDRLEATGGRRETLLHVAQSLFHDHEPALALGLETVWIDRQDGEYGATPPPSNEVSPTWTFASLTAFAYAIENS